LQLKKLPRCHESDQDEFQDRSQLQSRRNSSTPIVPVYYQPRKEGIGYDTIKESIKEVKEMQKKIKGKSGYLMDYFNDPVCLRLHFFFERTSKF